MRNQLASGMAMVFQPCTRPSTNGPPGRQDDADHPASHHGADDAVGKPDVAHGQVRHLNWNGRLVEVNQIEDGFPEARRQQQSQAQDDDGSRSSLDQARPDEQRRGDGCIRGVLLPLHAV